MSTGDVTETRRGPWQKLVERLGTRLIERAMRRRPDFIIGGEADAYLRRWWLIPRNRFVNVYLHYFTRGDDDRALHDHPWPFISIMLRGQYLALTAKGVDPLTHARMTTAEREANTCFTLRQPGNVGFYLPTHSHRVELIDNAPCWTLVVTGPRLRNWGFWCKQGWVHWRRFTDPATDGATVGRGCGD